MTVAECRAASFSVPSGFPSGDMEHSFVAVAFFGCRFNIFYYGVHDDDDDDDDDDDEIAYFTVR